MGHDERGRSNSESANSIIEKLSDFLEFRIKIQREIIPDLPPRWIRDQESCIKYIANSDPEQAVELMNCPLSVLHAIELIIPYADEISVSEIGNRNIKLWHFGNLLFCAKGLVEHNDEGFAIKQIQEHSFLATFLGLHAIHLLGVMRVVIYLEEQDTADQLHLRCSDIYPNHDPEYNKLVQNSLNNLIKFAKNTYKKKIFEKTNIPLLDDPDDTEFYSLIGEAVAKGFSSNLFEAVVQAASGYGRVKFIPNRAASRFISHQRREYAYSTPLVSIDAPRTENPDRTFRDMLTNNESNLLRSLENAETTEKSKEIAKYTSILTEKQKQVYLMHDSVIDGKKPTFQMIGDELSMSRERAYEIYVRAEKLIQDHLEEATKPTK